MRIWGLGKLISCRYHHSVQAAVLEMRVVAKLPSNKKSRLVSVPLQYAPRALVGLEQCSTDELLMLGGTSGSVD